MRNFYNKGGPTLVGKQKNLPEALKKKILMAKKKKKQVKNHLWLKWSERNGKALCKRQSSR